MEESAAVHCRDRKQALLCVEKTRVQRHVKFPDSLRKLGTGLEATKIIFCLGPENLTEAEWSDFKTKEQSGCGMIVLATLIQIFYSERE